MREAPEIRQLLWKEERLVQWHVGDRGDPFLMVVRNREVSIPRASDRKPDISITLKPIDSVLRLFSGADGAWERAMEERSIEIRGDWSDIVRLGEIVRRAGAYLV